MVCHAELVEASPAFALGGIAIARDSSSCGLRMTESGVLCGMLHPCGVQHDSQIANHEVKVLDWGGNCLYNQNEILRLADSE